MLLALQLNNLLEEAADLVEVPDVVGETQSAGTTTLETALFVVAVATAYSASVASGNIISQSPTAGSFAAEGSTVTITVSLGREPEAEATGGWFAFLNTYERQLADRRDRERKRRELEEETDRIEDATDRQIAQLLREQEAKDARRAELERLTALARSNADIEAARQYSERVAKALQAAIERGTLEAAQRLEKELRKAQEEEQFLLLAIMLAAE